MRADLCQLCGAGLTNDDGLRFTLDSDSGAGAGSHFHPVHHPDLQPAHHHRADGGVHGLVDVEARLIAETPDLQQTERKEKTQTGKRDRGG